MLTAKQYAVIERLARGANMQVAALEAGTTERTIRRWRDNPEFVGELRDAATSVREEVAMNLNAQVGQAQWLADRAVRRLDALSQAADIDRALRACNIAVNYNVKMAHVALKNNEQKIACPTTNGQKLPPTLDGLQSAPAVPASFRPVPQASSLRVSPKAESGKNRKPNDAGSTPASNGTHATIGANGAAGRSVTESPAPVSPSPSTERGPGGEVTRAAQSLASAPQKPTPEADETGQKRTISPDGKRVRVSATQPESGQLRTQPVTAEGGRGTPCATGGLSTSAARAGSVASTAAPVSPSPFTERGPGGEVTRAAQTLASAPQIPAPEADKSGQNRTFFADAKGLSASENESAVGQIRTSPVVAQASSLRVSTTPVSVQTEDTCRQDAGATSDPLYPTTREEFEADARELEFLAGEARAVGDMETVNELAALIAITRQRAAMCDSKLKEAG